MVAEPLIEPIPIETLGGEPSPAAPKRGRGRPPALNPDGTRRTPRRSTRPRKGSPRRAPAKPRNASLAPEITALLSLINAAVIMSPLGTRPVEAIDDATIMPERVGDELDGAEIAALAASLDAQCRRSPRFRKVIEGMLTASASGQIIGVVAMIAARRAARHGLAPAYIDPVLGMMLSGDGVTALAQFQVTPEPERRGPDDEPMPDRDAEPAPADIDFSTL